MLRRWLAFLAALVLAGCLLGPATARDARYGGTLVVGLTAGDPDTLDPTISRSAASVSIYTAMCQRLYERGPDLQLVPLLAASQPVASKDKLSYTIELRQGIRFNDGTPFNAQAVVTSIQRYLTYPGSTRATDYADVAGVTRSGPYRFVYRLKARDATFLGLGPYVLSPSALASEGSSFASNPVCVGPFMFDHRVVGDNVTVIKSPYYYDQKDVYLDKIVYRPTTNAAAAAAALKAGDIQALDQVSPSELPGVRQASSLRVVQAYQLGWQGVTFNIGNRSGLGNLPYGSVGTPFATSARLRQAFEEAIDRETLNRIVFGGIYQQTCTAIAPANALYFEATKVPCTPYDPRDAKKLVAASGFPNPTVRLATSNSTDDLRVAQFIQAEEAAVGIEVVIDSMDSTTLTARRVAGSFEATVTGLAAAGGEPNTSIAFYVATSGIRNYGGYSSPRLDYVLANGLKATAVAARAVNYRVAQQIVAADRPIIYLYNPVTFAAFSTALTGVRLTFAGGLVVTGARYG